MEPFLELREKSQRNLEIAEHILTVTYPLLKDPKLLLGVCENTFLGLTNSMSSVLSYELAFKRIIPYKDNFEGKYSVFCRKIVPRYNVKKEHLDLLQDVKSLVLKHRKSPVEFARKEKFVICDNGYQCETLEAPKLKGYLDKAKIFYNDMARITEKYENIFKRRLLK